VVDFGFTHPFTCQWWAKDHDGRLYMYREIYHTQLLVEDHAKRMLAVSGADNWRLSAEPKPVSIICDHDAEGRATLAKHLGMPTVAAKKEVGTGIQAVATRLRTAGDGKPRLFIMRDSLVRTDPWLEERKLPTCLAEELDGYIWNTGGGRNKGEEPVKENDHGCDAARYLICTLDTGSRQTAPPRMFGTGPRMMNPHG
jgi:phage terminase large subunit